MKLVGGNATNKTYALGWTIDEFSRLTEECCTLFVELTNLVEKLENQSTDIVQVNVSRTLTTYQEKLRSIIKSVVEIFEC